MGAYRAVLQIYKEAGCCCCDKWAHLVPSRFWCVTAAQNGAAILAMQPGNPLVTVSPVQSACSIAKSAFLQAAHNSNFSVSLPRLHDTKLMQTYTFRFNTLIHIGTSVFGASLLLGHIMQTTIQKLKILRSCRGNAAATPEHCLSHFRQLQSLTHVMQCAVSMHGYLKNRFAQQLITMAPNCFCKPFGNKQNWTRRLR